jgi:hypothetical protein
MKVFRVYMKSSRDTPMLAAAPALADAVKYYADLYGMKAIGAIEPTDLPLEGVRTIIKPEGKDQLDLFS